MSTAVWFIPGFMGSTLSLSSVTRGAGGVYTPPTPIWGSIPGLPALAFPQVLSLPGTLPPGRTVVADGLVPTWSGGYTDFVQYLKDNLSSSWSVFGWPYDWRQGARYLGGLLAAAIQGLTAQGFDHYILGHSYGALVAWSAWAALVDAGATDAITRIVTFGGALYGTESTPKLFEQDESALEQLPALAALFTGGPGQAFGIYAGGASDAQQAVFIACASSWPCIYDLFPDAFNLDDPGDNDRADLFQANTWTPALVAPNQSLIVNSITNFHGWLRQPKYLPPPNKVIHIVGAGYGTPTRVTIPTRQQIAALGNLAGPSTSASTKASRNAQLPGFTQTINGDGRCTIAQQMFPGYALVGLNAQHATMHLQENVKEAVIDAINAPVPPAPKPSTVAVPPLPPHVNPAPGSPLIPVPNNNPDIVPTMPAYLIESQPVLTSSTPAQQSRVGGQSTGAKKVVVGIDP